ncbi:MAG: hypothetical protein OIF48_17655 [Silicimonas sp.]|nr:hypothetical protein [Silicimonas sp.]
MPSKPHFPNLIALTLLCGGLAACSSSTAPGGGAGSPTATSSFTTLSGGSAAAGMAPASVTEDNVSLLGNTVAFAVGEHATTGDYVAASGIELLNVGTPLTSGAATYAADFGIALLEGVDGSSPQAIQGSGTIGLSADFDAGTLTGTYIGPDSNLSVNGTLSGGTIDGSVDYAYEDSLANPQTITGTLDGSIGFNGVVGAFHGHDADTVMAGGFVGSRLP